MLSSLFSFRGTIDRWALVRRCLFFVSAALIGGLIFFGIEHWNNGPRAATVSIIPFLAIAIVGFLSLAVRRLRDMGWPVLAGLAGLVFVSVVGGGLLRSALPFLSSLAPLGVFAAPIMLVALAPGLGFLALWPAYKSGGGLDREIEALRAAAEAEGRIAPRTTALPDSPFGRRST